MERTIMAITVLLGSVSTGYGIGFDDIEFWVGEGDNRATLVIDWNESHDAGTPLVWGYRWDGTATGADMLLDVLAADSRFYSKMSRPGSLGNAVFGFGYDANADASLALTDATSFDQRGIASTGASDLATSIDPADLYAEGWAFAGYWHYGLASANPYDGSSEWTSSPGGASFRTLSDGLWDAWTFTPTYASTAFPTAPDPAPWTELPGDYNRDGRVDAADYTAWRDSSGETPVVAGASVDGDFSGAIDAADRLVWRDWYGSGVTASATIPEPATAWLLAVLLFSFTELPRRAV